MKGRHSLGKEERGTEKEKRERRRARQIQILAGGRKQGREVVKRGGGIDVLEFWSRI